MKKILIGVLMVITVSSQAQYNSQNLRIESNATDQRLLYKNLEIYPVIANEKFKDAHRDVAKYTPLSTAMKDKKISITEKQSSSVNNLFVENISNDTIIILAGEVVEGGKQDRMLAQDVILPPKSGKKNIDVFCVEHGRWQEKQDGKVFKTSLPFSSNSVRKAGTVEKNQSEVWNQVEDKVSKNKAGTSTGTLAALKDSKPLTDELKAYTDYFSSRMKDENIIGVIAVSGNKVLGCDMFATHQLFQQYFGSLINSYATEAITNGRTSTLPRDEVKKYFDSIVQNETTQDNEIQKKGTLLKDGQKKVHISTF